jgi:type IV pilus biogenesis protein PilP
MSPEKVKTSLNTRQKIMIGVLAVGIIFVALQFRGIFSSDTPEPSPAANALASGPQPAPMPTPKPAEIAQPTGLTDREIALMKLQQETQAKYLEALNELQLLKINKDIANTNKDITAANLARVEAEKKIVDMLMPVAPPPSPAPAATTTTSVVPVAIEVPEVSYNLVSISQVQYKWSAVLSYNNNLYNVHVGDVLPPDGSTVVAIRKDSITLQKGGNKRKLSMVPII